VSDGRDRLRKDLMNVIKEMPMSERNVNVVKRFFEEAFNSGDGRLLDELHDSSHVSHLPNGDHYGAEGVRIDIAGYLEAFPDLRLKIDELFDAGETVAYRFTAQGTHNGPFLGVAPTGRPIRITGLGVDRLKDGKFVERWVQYDSAGLLQQIGVLPGFDCPGD
jgi:predicted ester cyclase